MYTYHVYMQKRGRVAQWIRASDSGSVGRGFESLRARFMFNIKIKT